MHDFGDDKEFRISFKTRVFIAFAATAAIFGPPLWILLTISGEK